MKEILDHLIIVAEQNPDLRFVIHSDLFNQFEQTPNMNIMFNSFLSVGNFYIRESKYPPNIKYAKTSIPDISIEKIDKEVKKFKTLKNFK